MLFFCFDINIKTKCLQWSSFASGYWLKYRKLLQDILCNMLLHFVDHKNIENIINSIFTWQYFVGFLFLNHLFFLFHPKTKAMKNEGCSILWSVFQMTSRPMIRVFMPFVTQRKLEKKRYMLWHAIFDPFLITFFILLKMYNFNVCIF